MCEANWGDLEGHAGAYILYYLDNEEVFQGLFFFFLILIFYFFVPGF